jgi:rhodanese-related sulfurtransferase
VIAEPNKEAPMQHAMHFRRPSFVTKTPGSAVLGLALAVALFAGGYAVGRDAWGMNPPQHHALEQQAAPLPGGVGLVTPAQVLTVPKDDYRLVDVRGHDAYEFAHAVGAISMPEADMDRMAAGLPTDRTLVLYCTCPDEKTSLRAARTLAGVYHVTNVVALKGGLLAYRAAGGALSSDATDSAIEHQGCGCKVTSPAFKLWVMNNEAAREKARQRVVEIGAVGRNPFS